MGEPDDLQQALAASATGMTPAFWAATSPQRTAIASSAGDRTFAELNANANALARALARRGAGAGDSIVVLCSNRPEFIETYAAAERTGLRLTPVNWHLTAHEVAYIMEDCGATAIVADARFAETAAQLPPVGVRLAVGGDIPGFDPYHAALGAEDPSDLDHPVRGSTMLYTSGTTGRPKGVHRDQPVMTPPATVRIFGYRPETDAHLCTGPLYHAAPLAFSMALPLLAGTPVVLMDAWDASDALHLIQHHRITHTHMVPTMFHRLLALPEEARAGADVSSVRFIVHGAAPCPVAVKQAIMAWFGPVVWEYYAATEGTGTFCDPHTWLAHPGTVGRPLVPGQILVGDTEAQALSPGEVGLVWLRGGAAPFRYWGDEAKTAGAYRGEYFTLGDMGYLDDDGFLYLTDRSADLIISGGVNIYPAAVDAVLLEHPAVGDVGTIGLPHEEWGEEVVAVVEPAAGLTPSPDLEAELIAFCRDRLAHYECPRRIEFTDNLPRSDAGKMQRRVLRERYRMETTQ